MSLPFHKFDCFSADVAEQVHDLGGDALKVLLSNVAPVATHTVQADLTEIAVGNGYAAGGVAVTTTASGQTGGTYTLEASQLTLTAVGGAIGPLQYFVLYNSTTAGGRRSAGGTTAHH